ncbi:MAG: protein O-mannosyl-transferase family [Candidatus Sumerlaeaceae bacterium]
MSAGIDEPMNGKGISWFPMPVKLIALALFLAALVVFWYHAAPTISFHDSGEFALATACGGLTHPPGAPTWCLLGTTLFHLGGFEDPARAGNMLAAMMGAVTVALLFLFAYAAIEERFPKSERAVKIFSALVAPAVLLNSAAFLEQCLIVEQYTLLTTLLLIFLLLIGWLDRKLQTGAWQPMQIISVQFLIGLIWALGYGNHPSQICCIVAVLLLLFVHYKQYGAKVCLHEAIWIGLGFSVGMLVFLWLPICGFREALMDPVRATTWERFWWGFTRAVYEKRSWAEVPDNYVRELLLTYDFIGELGFLGFTLAIIGVLFLVRSRSLMLGCSLIVVGAYAVGMFQGFVFQKGLTLIYLQYYGVRDWHLPLYLAGAFLAAIATSGVASRIRLTVNSPKVRLLTCAVVFAVSSVLAWDSVRENSMRHFTAPLDFIHDCMSVLPKDSIVIANGDNVSMMLAYYTCRTGRQIEPQRILYAYAVSSWDEKIRGKGDWTPETREWLVRALENPAKQPLRVAGLSSERTRNAPLFTDYIERNGPLADHLVPAGFLFRIQDHPTTTSEILEAELKWRREHPEAMRPPGKGIRHLEMEARGMVHWQRADFFHERQIWPLALEEYRRSLAWMPLNPVSWFGLGMCLEQVGAPAKDAMAAYRNALRYDKKTKNVRVNLAALEIAQENYKPAKELLEEELRINPINKAAKTNLLFVNEKLGTNQ